MTGRRELEGGNYMAEPLLQMTGISKRFGGVQALDRVDFAVRPAGVYCLAGENGSGKSTLIKVASGNLKPDAGSIRVAERSYQSFSQREALRSGIAVIYQDLSLLPNLSVAENIALASSLSAGRWSFRQRDARQIAGDVLQQLGVSLDLDAPVEDITIAAKQLTAISRALASDARVLFMDEPTTALTWREVQALFTVVRQLTAKGVAVVFVSHKLNEVLDISDHITVLRNGRVVADGPAREFDRIALTRAMTGHELSTGASPALIAPDAPPILEVEQLSADNRFANVSFSVRRGEILGMAGLLGSGAAEIADALFGISPVTEGTIRVNGAPKHIGAPADALKAGIGYVPGDRLSQGLFLRLPIDMNIVASSVDMLPSRAGLVSRRAVRNHAQRLVDELQIKTNSVSVPVSTLSGGNQQRVVLAKWFERQPAVLILNGPTVGVDIGSKEEIHRLLRSVSSENTSIIVLSDDIPELVALCHRVLIMRQGRLVAEVVPPELTEQSILQEMLA